MQNQSKASRMAKNSQSKFKSTRKPLRELYNGVNSSTLKQPSLYTKHNIYNTINTKPCPPLNHIKKPNGDDDQSLDRLLVIHSDLSSLLHQIDDLVGKAIRDKAMTKFERKEIALFTDVLSEMQNSLKPWVPRFQQAISSSSLDTDNQLKKSPTGKTIDIAADDDMGKIGGGGNQGNWDLMVSPSPLVSWRPSCMNEAGRQLFMLTPLTKGTISKLQGSTKPVNEILGLNINVKVGQPPLTPADTILLEKLVIDSDEGIVAKTTPIKVSDSIVTGTESTTECKFKSPEKASKISCSIVAMTPCREVSPPKSCKLLEPMSEFTRKKVPGVCKATPFPTGNHKFSESDDPDSSSGEASKNLISKYPELVAIKVAREFGNGRKAVEASPIWCMSPPKTCIVMEPPEEKMLNTTTSLRLPTPACTPCVKTKKDLEYKGLNDGLTVIESTPCWKEHESSMRTGKRPGENTLKKELWTKFEAATGDGIRFGKPVCKSGLNKGFLDLLEEVTSDEETDVPAQVDRC